MSSKRSLIPNKPRRIQRRGLLFTVVRFAGLLLKVAGLLLLAIALISFFFMFVRLAPTLIESVRQPNQNMAGFVFLVSLGSLLFFPIIGLVAVAMTGVGFALGYVGTEPRVDMGHPIESPADNKESELPGESETENGNA
jgi:hypothetical protein